jgi:N-acetylglutamate synthase-like GNAT family acetyltransferase
MEELNSNVAFNNVPIGIFIEQAEMLLDQVNGKQSISERIDEIRIASDGLFIAKEEDKVIACASLLYPIWDQAGIILHFAVDAKYRRKGIGRELFGQVQLFSENYGLKKLVVQTALHSQSSIDFWKSLGFTINFQGLYEYMGEGSVLIWLDKNVDS